MLQPTHSKLEPEGTRFCKSHGVKAGTEHAWCCNRCGASNCDERGPRASVSGGVSDASLAKRGAADHERGGRRFASRMDVLVPGYTWGWGTPAWDHRSSGSYALNRVIAARPAGRRLAPPFH